MINEDFSGFYAMWNGMEASAKKAFVNTYHLGMDFFNDMEKGAMTASSAVAQFSKSLGVSEFKKSSRFFDDVADSIL